MPIKKTSLASRSKKPVNKVESKEELLDFEQFVSQKPMVHRGKGWLFATLIVVIIVLASIVYFMMQSTSLQKELKFKVVYMDNGQVYYAKIVKEDSLNLYLDDVYYIQTQQQTVPSEVEGEEPQVVNVPVLMARSQEWHQPQGYLQINRDKVVAIDEIGQDSEIYQEIQKVKQAASQQ
ncbi:MAG: hypothetical protein COV55_01735 [Candidatus Komeilibacteria bacterium CG11_big_fil_rev_8_21_14_0_20_36_20]|uniref:Uncharacterized protein n=1 Tax=Candidatus Komeilibacteria bacterium CG11_big_fil_rev_8_21_14_0_20_36_20 TaxID=1974477 RepID=A0A2H0NE13_9BACT|nr:MAG: hypothetical protein COV55_01735 [Candidatus Komeilibacteria bacterium CG11_big_fil_rev_8_21_14_0_20_36_20]PIR81264.1 MAG: hypothetical protein COU21_04720 [Candidatus Komeilibacteria bacterium CG10_big_fil_rev_8_21_14_0_10_36_65]PJC55228.1 MAG: hypothetical protein CO027_03660 [Candidatus Komeilibacteria bacterium CG_4_9_14_0_2_um_filter_36_13]